ncbi:MAG: P-II family nitrogen regulator [Planctomycetota bacterium]
MRLVIAYIRPEKLTDVKNALAKAEVLKISVTNALGCGDEPATHEQYRGAGIEVDLQKRVRLEIAVNEQYVDKTVKAIIEGGAAKAGEPGADQSSGGDGKIFVLALEDCYRIRTGERGDDAIG